MTRALLCCGVAGWMSIAWGVSGVAAQTAPAPANNESPQIARGRLVVAQACTTCHTTLGRMLQVHKQTAAQWKDTVYFMISRGAQVMPDEIDAVAAYLADASARPAARGAQDRGN